MIISFSKNFIFIKAPKTAGTSVEEALSWSCNPEIDIIGRDIGSNRPGINYDKFKLLLVNHSPPADFIKSGAITQNQFDSMYKIATVRNPWEVQVSRWWMDVTKTQTDPRFSYKNLSIKEITSRYKSDFHKWILSYFNFTDRLINEDHFYFNEDGDYFLQDIIRYETLHNDFKRLSKVLNLKQYDLPHFHGKHRLIQDHYREYYTSETRDIISHHYQNIIQYFGYKF